MQVAAFVAVVRSPISGKETRERLLGGLAVRVVRSGFKYPVAAWQRKQVYHVSCLRRSRRIRQSIAQCGRRASSPTCRYHPWTFCK